VVDQQIHSTSCVVEIVTPDGVQLVFSTDDAVLDLLHVSTHNDMAEACGSFTLTFAPRMIEGRTYDQLIPMRSLVTIKMQDPVTPVNETESVVMIGLTDDHGFAEDYSRAQPQRVVTISGRSIAGVMLDARLFYHPGLEGLGTSQTMPSFPTGTIRDAELGDKDGPRMFWDSKLVGNNEDPRTGIAIILTHFLGIGSPDPTPRQAVPGTETRVLARQETAAKAQAVNPTLSRPKAAIQAINAEQAADATLSRREAALRVADQMGGTGNGQTSLPIQVTTITDDYLNTKAVDALVAKNPTLTRPQAMQMVLEKQQNVLTGAPLPKRPRPSQPPAVPATATPKPAAPPAVFSSHHLINLQLPGRTLADLLDLNRAAWTLFEKGVTVPIGPNTAFAGVVWNYLRVFIDRMFQEFFTRIEDGVCKIHFRAKPFLQQPVTTGTRFRADDLTCQTLPLSDADLLVWLPRRQSATVYNVFLVVPLGASTSLQSPSFKYEIAPTYLADPKDPSYIFRYGLRVLEHSSPYLNATQTVPDTPANASRGHVVDAAIRWGKILAAWYGAAPELYASRMTVRGSPSWNLGHRLLWQEARGRREGYIEGVSHSYDFRTGRYLTDLRVTRIWYLDAPIDARGGQRVGVQPIT
jgi:hypothetical protein